MPQVFSRPMNVLAKATIVGGLLSTAFLLWVCSIFVRSSYGTDAGVVRVQPIPFSHQHHVGVLGIDCRYCHTSVEQSSFAGMPSTKICMNCHSQMWVGSSMLEPVRESYRTDQSIRWKRVYNLPGFVYFDHSIHVAKGVGCTTCHGQIDQMPLTYQVPSLLMEWCIDCHRAPEHELRPVEAVFDVNYRRPAEQLTLGRMLVERYHVDDAESLTSCSVCHR